METPKKKRLGVISEGVYTETQTTDREGRNQKEHPNVRKKGCSKRKPQLYGFP